MKPSAFVIPVLMVFGITVNNPALVTAQQTEEAESLKISSVEFLSGERARVTARGAIGAGESTVVLAVPPQEAAHMLKEAMIAVDGKSPRPPISLAVVSAPPTAKAIVTLQVEQRDQGTATSQESEFQLTWTTDRISIQTGFHAEFESLCQTLHVTPIIQITNNSGISWSPSAEIRGFGVAADFRSGTVPAVAGPLSNKPSVQRLSGLKNCLSNALSLEATVDAAKLNKPDTDIVAGLRVTVNQWPTSVAADDYQGPVRLTWDRGIREPSAVEISVAEYKDLYSGRKVVNFDEAAELQSGNKVILVKARYIENPVDAWLLRGTVSVVRQRTTTISSTLSQSGAFVQKVRYARIPGSKLEKPSPNATDKVIEVELSNGSANIIEYTPPENISLLQASVTGAPARLEQLENRLEELADKLKSELLTTTIWSIVWTRKLLDDVADVRQQLELKRAETRTPSPFEVVPSDDEIRKVVQQRNFWDEQRKTLHEVEVRALRKFNDGVRTDNPVDLSQETQDLSAVSHRVANGPQSGSVQLTQR